jgi:hypothetical protein
VADTEPVGGQIGRYGGMSIRELYDLLDERAAQVAALKIWESGVDCSSHCDHCGIVDLLANIPAAAVRNLAAEKVARALDVADREPTTANLSACEARLNGWRKAAQG